MMSPLALPDEARLKRAALRLALLPTSDRNWLLKRLPGAHRQAVEEHLKALSRFPIQALAGMKSDLERLFGSPIAANVGRVSAAIAEPRPLNHAPSDDLLKVLRQLPLEGAGLVASRASPETGATIVGSLRPRNMQAGRLDALPMAVSDAFVDLLVEVVEDALECRGAGAGRVDSAP